MRTSYTYLSQFATIAHQFNVMLFKEGPLRIIRPRFVDDVFEVRIWSTFWGRNADDGAVVQGLKNSNDLCKHPRINVRGFIYKAEVTTNSSDILLVKKRRKKISILETTGVIVLDFIIIAQSRLRHLFSLLVLSLHLRQMEKLAFLLVPPHYF